MHVLVSSWPHGIVITCLHSNWQNMRLTAREEALPLCMHGDTAAVAQIACA